MLVAICNVLRTPSSYRLSWARSRCMRRIAGLCDMRKGQGGHFSADVGEGVEVVREDAAGGHAGAHPAVALLLLRVHPQHVPPLPRHRRTARA